MEGYQKKSSMQKIQECLAFIYGEDLSPGTLDKAEVILDQYRRIIHPSKHKPDRLTQKDSILITYGDQLVEQSHPPLSTLGKFCNSYLKDLVSTIHILPFFPYSSDDGFSVIDYKQVNPHLGTWEDINYLGKNFSLMFDAVVNHVSSQSDWFQAFLKDDPVFQNFFIVIENNPDLSQVVRPRTSALLTSFPKPSGSRSVWTTFSADQIDLNFHHPDVLVEIIDILLLYVSHGARFIRLDAIAYLWKEIGTRCIHLPQTHRIIQLFRAILDEVSPDVFLITETNVSHQENISYFGDGFNEAQLVYNFALPPLVLHMLRSGDASIFSQWAKSLALPSPRTTFFNFLASHDGIGLNPARGILSDQEINTLVEGTIANGGFVNYRDNPDGSRSPYELNINYFDALCQQKNLSNNHPMQIDCFMTAQAIMLSLAGVPGIYFHSLFGSSGWPEGVKRTGQNRSINRQKFELARFEAELNDTASRRHQVYGHFSQMLKARASSTAFDPFGEQSVLDYGEHIFVVKRSSPDHRENVLCVSNITNEAQDINIEQPGRASGEWMDLISGKIRLKSSPGKLHLNPYETLWLAQAQGSIRR